MVIDNFGTDAALVPRELTERLRAIGNLIDAGRLGEAREQLEESRGEPADLVELMRLKLRVVARELEPSSALQSVIAFLKGDTKHPAAMSLYHEFSMLQYQAGQSCPSFSHPPPARDEAQGMLKIAANPVPIIHRSTPIKVRID